MRARSALTSPAPGELHLTHSNPPGTKPFPFTSGKTQGILPDSHGSEKKKSEITSATGSAAPVIMLAEYGWILCRLLAVLLNRTCLTSFEVSLDDERLAFRFAGKEWGLLGLVITTGSHVFSP